MERTRFESVVVMKPRGIGNGKEKEKEIEIWEGVEAVEVEREEGIEGRNLFEVQKESKKKREKKEKGLFF